MKIEEDQDVGYHEDSSDEELERGTTAADLDCSYQEHDGYKDGVLTIGCIGNQIFFNFISVLKILLFLQLIHSAKVLIGYLEIAIFYILAKLSNIQNIVLFVRKVLYK